MSQVKARVEPPCERDNTCSSSVMTPSPPRRDSREPRVSPSGRAMCTESTSPSLGTDDVGAADERGRPRPPQVLAEDADVFAGVGKGPRKASTAGIRYRRYPKLDQRGGGGSTLALTWLISLCRETKKDSNSKGFKDSNKYHNGFASVFFCLFSIGGVARLKNVKCSTTA